VIAIKRRSQRRDTRRVWLINVKNTSRRWPVSTVAASASSVIERDCFALFLISRLPSLRLVHTLGEAFYCLDGPKATAVTHSYSRPGHPVTYRVSVPRLTYNRMGGKPPCDKTTAAHSWAASFAESQSLTFGSTVSKGLFESPVCARHAKNRSSISAAIVGFLFNSDTLRGCVANARNTETYDIEPTHLNETALP
jgi:hypothetical protein